MMVTVNNKQENNNVLKFLHKRTGLKVKVQIDSHKIDIKNMFSRTRFTAFILMG